MIDMEWEIGEIKQINGEWYQCLKSPDGGCKHCDMNFGGKCPIPLKECVESGRSDKSYVIFKKLEKVGEPVKYNGSLYQGFKAENTIIDVCRNCAFWEINCGAIMCDTNVFFKRIKQTKEDMGDNTDIRPYDELFSPGTVSNTKHLAKEDMEEKEPTYEELLHYYHSTVGLWAIDRNPQEVDFDWICKNAFQLGMDKTLPNCERIGKDLKPFNLEAARSGKPVCTRDGRKARIICFDRRLFYKNVSYPILAVVERSDGEDDVCGYNEKGKVLIEDGAEYKDDLMMLPEKKEGWAVIFKDDLLRTEKEAQELAGNSISEVIRIEKIEWEE